MTSSTTMMPLPLFLVEFERNEDDDDDDIARAGRGGGIWSLREKKKIAQGVTLGFHIFFFPRKSSSPGEVLRTNPQKKKKTASVHI